MSIIDDKKIKKQLKQVLKRNPKKHEVENAYQDFNIVNNIIIEKLEDLETRVKKLEQ